VKESIVKKWGKYLPLVALLLFPGGMFIVGAWLAVGHIRHGDDLAEDDRKGLAAASTEATCSSSCEASTA
jgi:hypothetical protein